MTKAQAIRVAKREARRENWVRSWYVVKSDYYDDADGRDYYPATRDDVLTCFVGEPVVYLVRSD